MTESFVFTDASVFLNAVHNASLFMVSDKRDILALPALAGVRIEYAEREMTFVGTDRYLLSFETVKVQSDSAALETFLGHSEVKSLLAVHRGASMTLLVSVSDTEIRVESDKGTTVHQVGNAGEFIRWRSVVPFDREPVAVETIGFNPAYLAKLAKIKTTERSVPVVRFQMFGRNKPVLAHIPFGPTVLVMPVREAA